MAKMDDREKVLSEFEKWCDEMADECPVICRDALALLNEQEAVVRCKDCRFFMQDESQCAVRVGWFPVKEDWFCADGVKRDD